MRMAAFWTWGSLMSRVHPGGGAVAAGFLAGAALDIWAAGKQQAPGGLGGPGDCGLQPLPLGFKTAPEGSV